MRHLFHTDDCGISLICRCCRGPTCERRLDLTDIRSLERDLWSERTVLYFSKKDRGLRLKRKILSLLASGFKAALRQILALMEGLSNMSSKQNKRVASDLLTERTQVYRRPERACYDRNVIYSILDEALYCNIAFTVEDQPYAIPTIHTRVADFLYIHGSAANRMLRVAAQDVKLCVTVTLLDGLVLARSAFHHSLNYRSVMILGAANEITGPS
jgi:hypothetical protein